MTGNIIDYKYRGLIPRCISNLFEEIRKREDLEITVGISYLEDYNDNLTDLFNPNSEQKIMI